ncbi:hypothetical protein HK405_005014, partial [Cladochytrium tenue]
RKPRPGAAATASAEQPTAPCDVQPAAQWVLRAHRTHRGLRDSSLLVAAGPLPYRTPRRPDPPACRRPAAPRRLHRRAACCLGPRPG